MSRLKTMITPALSILSVLTGFAEMAPDTLRKINPDGTLCLIILIGMPLFAIGSVYYSVAVLKQTCLRRPKWSRFTLDWRRDPLQCLFLTGNLAGFMALGAAIRLPGTTRTGYWTFMVFVCMFIGLSVGRAAVYRLYRGNIVDN